MHLPKFTVYFLLVLDMILFVSCIENTKSEEKNLARDHVSLNALTGKSIQKQINYIKNNEGKTSDSIALFYPGLLEGYYEQHEFAPFWSNMGKWQPLISALSGYFDKAIEDGLFKEDYHFRVINRLKDSLDSDSLKRQDPVLWAMADIYCTDAFIHILYDLKFGRLQPDSQYMFSWPVMSTL